MTKNREDGSGGSARSVLYFGDLAKLCIRDTDVVGNYAKANIVTFSQLVDTEITGSTFSDNRNQVFRAFQRAAGRDPAAPTRAGGGRLEAHRGK